MFVLCTQLVYVIIIILLLKMSMDVLAKALNAHSLDALSEPTDGGSGKKISANPWPHTLPADLSLVSFSQSCLRYSMFPSGTVVCGALYAVAGVTSPCARSLLVATHVLGSSVRLAQCMHCSIS